MEENRGAEPENRFFSALFAGVWSKRLNSPENKENFFFDGSLSLLVISKILCYNTHRKVKRKGFIL